MAGSGAVCAGAGKAGGEPASAAAAVSALGHTLCGELFLGLQH